MQNLVYYYIMLIGINPVVNPELLNALFRMGHGDEIVLADAFFPGDSVNPRVIRADGAYYGKDEKRLVVRNFIVSCDSFCWSADIMRPRLFRLRW